VGAGAGVKDAAGDADNECPLNGHFWFSTASLRT
jgi:hypothetical protein